MIVAESRRTRRLVGRLDRGTDILESLAEICRSHSVRAGELRATGALEQVVLCEYDQRGRAFRAQRRFESQFEILTLSGNVSERDGKLFVQAFVSLSRERDNGIELVGGRLVSGRVFAVEVIIDTFDDLILRRALDAQTGLPLWSEAISLEPPKPSATVAAATAPTSSSPTSSSPTSSSPTSTSPSREPEPEPVVERVQPSFEAKALTVAKPHAVETAPAWRDVVAVSESRAEPARPRSNGEDIVVPSPPDEEAKPMPGDWIEHPKFGKCQVERIEGDYEYVSARLRNQRLIRLSLDVLTLEPAGREGEHALFRAVPVGR